MTQVLLYTDKNTARLRYVLKVLEQLMGVHFSITQNQDVFYSASGMKIYYGIPRQLGRFLSIAPQGILEGNGIQKQSIVVKRTAGIPYFFESLKKGFFAFDVFAASFYLLSRYEEYLPSQKDAQGRYLAKNSIAFKEGFLLKPIVHYWAKWLSKALIEQYGVFNTAPLSAYEFELTVDVDQAYAFTGKTLVNTLISLAYSLLNGRFLSYLNVVFGKEKDPYDHTLFFKELSQKYHLTPRFFIHLGGRAKHDPVGLSKKVLKKYIDKLRSLGSVGLHPSYHSTRSPSTLNKEHALFKALNGGELIASRQHFIFLDFPQTYSAMLEKGVEEDYTMGYPEASGFRAGIAFPFFWFDLLENKETTLKIFPFWLMDIHRNRGAISLEKIAEVHQELRRLKAYNSIVIHSHLFALSLDPLQQKEQAIQFIQYGH